MKTNSQKSTNNKFIACIAALILVVMNVFTAFSQLKYGVKAGLNLADVEQAATLSGQFTSENVTINAGGSGATTTSTTVESFNQTVTVSTTPLISFYAGGYLEKPINKKQNLAVRIELLYARNGTNVDEQVTTSSNEAGLGYSSSGVKFIVHQLNAPILIKYTTNKKLAFTGGFYFGTILSAEAIAKNGETFDLKERLKNFDFGLSVGASYPINKKLSAEFSYHRGIANLDPFKAALGSFQLATEFYTRALHFGLAYQLN